MVARVGGIMVPAALDAVRAAAGLPGRWEEIAGDLEELRACLLNPSSHPCLANNNALCRVVLQSVAHTLAVVTDLPARCREPQTEGKLRSAVNKVALQLDVNLRDCKLLVKIGELYDAASSPPLLVDATSSSSCVDVKELQRLFAWMEMSHTEAKHFALDGLLEALKKDETRVVSMLHIDNVSAVVKLLAASWPAVIREKAATVACHVAGSDDKCVLLEAELEDELIRLVESGSVVGRQKAAVTLQHLTSKSRTAAWYIVFHGGVGPLIGMCQSQSAAAITGWICGFADLPQLLAGIVRVMVGLLQYCGGDDASESAECLKTAGGDYSVSQLAAASTLKNISTAPLLQQSLQDHGIVRVMVGLLRSGDAVPALKEQAAECLANLASGENNNDKLRRAFVSEGALPALVQLLDPTRNANTNTNTAKKHAIHCLLSLAATDRCRKLIISHGAKGHLAKLSEMNVPGAAALLYRLERGTLAGIISSSNQESFTASVLFD
ncbi:hypothetical protein PR202_gb13399 [Eleusine coracana subsp. coracana]|uniref:DUF7032 domain-containing protein n=1 Tax=Eleusine coracana subsp. coracana TaxID=191504 RepID=A0AAV5ESJ6_ELECO|nr:hypothetical protein QOZ80_9BG0714470 [Eleusine coracana subsp. coracana]GJN25556.1 hypothetical protein PR202_gb13399 [Eleusine coracana subsp. coracana]